jgi:hypothetical protein
LEAGEQGVENLCVEALRVRRDLALPAQSAFYQAKRSVVLRKSARA